MNSSLMPADVLPRGLASAWWRCRLGQAWKAKVAPRTTGVGCPLF
ncbi:MAG: zinc-ribbon domain-containing protein [Mycobacterium sp.]